MESAIKTIVTTFVSSARGKENLDGKSFQKMVKKQLGGIMEVRPCTTVRCSPLSFGVKRKSIRMSEYVCIQYSVNPFVSRIQTAHLPLRRCSKDWMRTAMERSASRNTSLWLATWPTLLVRARANPTQMHRRSVVTCSVWWMRNQKQHFFTF